jgi:hypothetical protein
LSLGDIPTDIPELEELRRLLEEAIEKRKKIVDVSRNGSAPHMFNYGYLGSAMRSALADETAPEVFKRSVQTVLDAWSRSIGDNAFPSSPTDDTFVPVTEKFGTIQFTGFTLPAHDPTLGEYPLEGDILAGLGNIFMLDQLALLYIVRPDRSVFMNVIAGGYLQKEAEGVQRQIEDWYPKIVKLWRTCSC